MTQQTLTFEQYVASWNELVGRIEEIKKSLKTLTDAEMPMRKAIAEAVGKALPEGTLVEGVNTYPMPDGRKLKVTRKVKREIEKAVIADVRKAYELLNDRPIAFDALLRTKYELEKREWDKLGPEAKLAVSRMIISKDEAPAVVLD